MSDDNPNPIINTGGTVPLKMPPAVAGSSFAAPAGSVATEPVIIENATCDGCGNANTYVQVVNGASAANVCLCRGCLELESH